jgi:hypothetical protein
MILPTAVATARVVTVAVRVPQAISRCSSKDPPFVSVLLLLLVLVNNLDVLAVLAVLVVLINFTALATLSALTVLGFVLSTATATAT